MEFDTVKEAMASIIDTCESTSIEVNGRPATTEEILEYVCEQAYALADLLGMSDLYLRDRKEA
ncbi:hypothetical protein [Lacticaseibacillus absianus]|uniref:hypothetical protein n=1 Tax=Lacticaseibacillus absianus TaxID=2729623 RepID=UPI0015C90446|nr:hypothetical protein [Lacticaseibacillus absianus]